MATTFPGTQLTILVELFLGGVWTDVSTYVLFDDTIFIHHGFTPTHQSNDATPDYCFVTFINFDKTNHSSAAGKRFSPRNLAGPYYGLLGVNTPIRISWNAGNGLKTRFEGLVPDWTANYDVAEIRHVRIQAFDRRHQLTTGTGRKINNSPIYTSDTGATQLVTYMPLEDLESTDTPLIIGNTSGKAVALSGTFNWAQNSALPGSKPAVQLTGNSYLIMNVASHSFAGHWQFDFFYYLANYPTADTILFRCWVGNTGASGISFWDIIMKTGAYRVIAYDRNGVAKVDSGDVINSGWVLNTWMHHRLMVQNASATTFDWQYVTFPLSGGGFFLSGSGVTGQCGNIGSIFLLPNAEKDQDAVAHMAVFDAYNFSTVDSSGNGYNAEPPGTRWSRLLNEVGVPNVRRVPGWADTVAMGKQTSNDLQTLLRECLLANEGFMDTTTGLVGSEGGRLRFTERGFIENQAIAWTLDYSARVLKSLKTPDDDFGIVNDFTGSRTDGASLQLIKTSGPRNISDRSIDRLGVGRYDTANTYSLSDDGQLAAHVGWTINKGTADSPRVASVQIWFERAAAVTNNLLATWETLDTWKRMKITNPPTDIGPDPLDFYIAGYDEVFTQKWIHVDINGRAAAPYDVGILDSSGGATSDQRLDSNDTDTLNILDASQVTVRTRNNGSEFIASKWAHDTGDYRVRIDGEEMTVTAVADVATSLVGVGTGGTSNNANIVGLNINGSSAKDDTMVAVVYCRNTAATVGLTGTGWAQIDTAGFTNFKVFSKVHSGSESGPTATVSGGASGDDLIAQIATFRGIAPRALTTVPQSNGSAQDIAWPSFAANRQLALYLVIGAKVNAWTSVATVAGGFTEIAEVISTIGNDASLVWDYFFGTTGTVFSAGTFTVTGGVAATSQAISIALDCNVQALTVTRGVNNGNIGIGNPINQEVHVTNPIILGV